MAQNLRAKIPESDRLVIHDRNAEATTKFLQEVGLSTGNRTNIEMASSPREVAEKSVSYSPHTIQPPFHLYDEYVLSMI